MPTNSLIKMYLQLQDIQSKAQLCVGSVGDCIHPTCLLVALLASCKIKLHLNIECGEVHQL